MDNRKEIPTTPLSLAVRTGRVNEVKQLLKNGYDVNSITDEDLEFLRLAEEAGRFRFAGYGTQMQDDTVNTRYEYDPLDSYDKYVIKYERVIPLGTYDLIKRLIKDVESTSLFSFILSRESFSKVFDLPVNAVISLKNVLNSSDLTGDLIIMFDPRISFDFLKEIQLVLNNHQIPSDIIPQTKNALFTSVPSIRIANDNLKEFIFFMDKSIKENSVQSTYTYVPKVGSPD